MTDNSDRLAVAVCGCLVALVFLAGCEEEWSRPVAGVETGMTEREIVEHLGPPTERTVTRTFSRDSALWTLAGSDPVPRRVWSFNETDMELSRIVATGDTALSVTNRWSGRKADWPWQSTRTWTVFYEQTDEAWTVSGSEDRSDGLTY